MIHLIPCRLYNHFAFTYILRRSLELSVKRTWTGSTFSTDESACKAHGPSVSCVEWPLYTTISATSWRHQNLWHNITHGNLACRTCSKNIWLELRYEGVIRSFFHVLRLLPITFTQHNLNRISKYQHEDQSSYGLRLGLCPCWLLI